MKEKLLKRLDDLGSSLSSKEECLGLLALGSCGKELERMDDYSDLDFFVIVKNGHKDRYLRDLSWLSEIFPLAYQFRNTIDGYKVLYEDGIYAEFAVFTLDEMPEIGFSEGRFVFKKEDCELSPLPNKPIQELKRTELDFAINELLTNLLVGLMRERRGERLAAFRLIQVHAVDRLLSVLHLIQTETPGFTDPYALDRRVETRFPQCIKAFRSWMNGYDGNLDSAKALLEFVSMIYPVNPALKREIERYLG